MEHHQAAASMAIAQEIEIALKVVEEVNNNIEGGMEDATIQWRGERIIVEDLSDDDTVFHFRFRKKRLQEIADKLWPLLEINFNGTSNKQGIVFDKGRYCCPYETHLPMVIFRFSRARRIRKEMEGFFGMRRSKILAGVNVMADTWQSLAVQYLDNPRIFHFRMP